MECEKFIKKKCGDIFEIKSILFEVVEGCPVVHMTPTLGYCEIVVSQDPNVGIMWVKVFDWS